MEADYQNKEQCYLISYISENPEKYGHSFHIHKEDDKTAIGWWENWLRDSESELVKSIKESVILRVEEKDKALVFLKYGIKISPVTN